MKTIILHGGHECSVDDDVFGWASRYYWYRTRNGYAVRYAYGVDGKECSAILMHRLIARAGPDEQVRHVNGVKLDNRRENLQLTDIKAHSKNHMMMGKPRREGCFKGVYRYGQQKNWQAKIKVNKRVIHLGTFPTERDAAIAYNKAALEAFGEGCFQNEV
jgi:AP2-like factor (euAP2 lineage)